MCDSFSGHQDIQGPGLLDVVHRLLVRDHGEVVAVELQDLVVHHQPGPAGGAVGRDLCNVHSAVCIAL